LVTLEGIKALTFDVFGTVVDWRTSVAREAEIMLRPKGFSLDWANFADRWRAGYVPAMAAVSSGGRGFVILDVLHREILLKVLADLAVTGLSEAELDELNWAWHRLDPWADTVAGLTRLKRRFMLVTLSNGNVRLMVDMAKRGGMPWDAILGAEVSGFYKPTPESYDRTAQFLQLQPAECLMVAAHPSDLAAAATRGFRTAYVHRPLEFGPDRNRSRPEPGTFDLAVDSFEALADALGC
jgi:2-haloacid dehalogenase